MHFRNVLKQEYIIILKIKLFNEIQIRWRKFWTSVFVEALEAEKHHIPIYVF